MHTLKQSTASEPLLFLMIDSLLHIAGKTGLAPTVTLSKNGAPFGAPAGAVTELASGWYAVAANATDTNTVGPLILHATAAGADPVDDRYQVVAYNPRTASLDLVLAKTTNLTGLNDIPATDVVSAGPITTAAGAVASVGLVSGNVVGSVGSVVAGVALTVAERTATATALLALVDGIESGVTLAQAVARMAAILGGLITGAGSGTETFKAMGQPAGGTTRAVVVVDNSGNRTAITY